MQGGMALLTIIAIIAIVVIAAGIIVVIANLIMGAFTNKREESEPKTSDYVQEQNVENNVQEEYNFEAINTAKAEQEQKLANEEPAEQELVEEPAEEAEEPVEEAEEEDLDKLEESLAKENSEEANSDEDDLDDLLDGITNDIVDEEKEKQSEVKMDESLDQYSIDDFLNEETEDAEAETVEEAPVEEAAVEQPVATVNNEELEALKAQLEEANRKLEEARNGVKLTTTEQDCLDRLAILEERLKNAKAELRVNSKEYRPLKKVYNEYERNLAKYRRKNAQVAKMKTDLYGVNNYVDLDKEEAQKLANEIDVLDGLRLSINHCEQVINESKDRYPILEHTNKILTEQIAEIEQDIESNKAILAKIREEQGEGEGENN